MKFEEYVFEDNDRRRYFISDRRGTYVKSIKLIDGASLYESLGTQPKLRSAIASPPSPSQSSTRSTCQASILIRWCGSSRCTIPRTTIR